MNDLILFVKTPGTEFGGESFVRSLGYQASQSAGGLESVILTNKWHKEIRVLATGIRECTPGGTAVVVSGTAFEVVAD